MTCNGCKHYQKTFEECGQLQGWLYCSGCNRKWQMSDRIGCPKCAEFKAAKPLWECAGAVPSRQCPGFVSAVEKQRQPGLFD